MRYWWVNQNQTYKQEVLGGYLWSPKTKANGARNPFYEFMREVSPGDVVFSFCDTEIKAIGIAQSNAYEAPKPLEFGKVGAYWDLVGWRVDVRFSKLVTPIRPAAHINVLRPYLAEKYAPLRSNGHGQQSTYLTQLSDSLGDLLVALIGTEGRMIVQAARVEDFSSSIPNIGQVIWEEHQLSAVQEDDRLMATEKQSIVLARRGQGLFRQRVSSVERVCRITRVSQPEYLRASHSKPWRDSNNEERLNGENGLLLTPDVDLLFDRGFISFEDNGNVLVSPVADRTAMSKMGLTEELLGNVGAFSQGQRTFLQFHRESVFLEAKVVKP
ncbi:MAG: HNH endonuclease [Polaromonas sp.]|nr:HNH endonuclease [Polaromonas sp.]